MVIRNKAQCARREMKSYLGVMVLFVVGVVGIAVKEWKSAQRNSATCNDVAEVRAGLEQVGGGEFLVRKDGSLELVIDHRGTLSLWLIPRSPGWGIG
ncbi:MAG: hypothetical protein COZ49_04035 [Candidatus Yonathbacteria bacterium CG_4_10_14_3_um_filter_47_65]|uniref:Uncharacterized protein n=2 Tax=Parcubacteria group TaxID=1794811 RepID=A0A2M8D5K5_9BACT|nr:MAG: hypothetical protein AUJ44_01435 [Candidatus Nomurabacteria bacterium CG1_02_47_685]PIX56059.1 MAG: hypothetical protein COZ49_04035 [Candidatus Yonathbacteria bacterium CG_4_10_14_3_um_filter_47_65]PIY57569.1 MAG: hypothetical protein COY99_02420 [Candidatus Yonathbacteria bacterium CG_4_10_14_0_8_um_filter_47_645]PJB81856.1 MAG: hypothetical protein CO088_04315 [Candidatus Yonathbacteria bacterium CG_4_9_14_0_8_um_filter_46_47]PJC20125.1 MAG: hypothetical protein CO061_03555 [Candidat